MTFVIDASTALRLVFHDEGVDARQEIERRLARDPDAIAPALFLEETSNALVTAVRRRRIRAVDATGHLGRLAQLPIGISHHVPSPTRLVEIALKHGLTAYDATYLELSSFLGVPILTHDAALERAARAEGIAV